MKNLTEQEESMTLMRRKIGELKLAIDEEYKRIGRNVPQIIERETLSVNNMVDELVCLNRKLKALEEGADGEDE